MGMSVSLKPHLCMNSLLIRSLKTTDLGKTSSLIATDDGTNNAISVISYWKSIEGLQAFAQGDQHRKGWDWYLKLKHANFGIMHETYVVPAGMWENISVNMKPFGLGENWSNITK